MRARSPLINEVTEPTARDPQQRARAHGKSIEQFLRDALAAETCEDPHALPANEREQRFRELLSAATSRNRGVDDRREHIYEDRGGMTVLIDTNVLTGLVQPGSPPYPAAANAVTTLRKAGNSLMMAAQLVYEFWAVTTRPIASAGGLGMPPATADPYLAAFE